MHSNNVNRKLSLTRGALIGHTAACKEGGGRISSFKECRAAETVSRAESSGPVDAAVETGVEPQGYGSYGGVER